MDTEIHNSSSPPSAASPPKQTPRWALGVGAAGVTVLLALLSLRPLSSRARPETDVPALPAVAVVPVVRGNLSKDLRFEAEFRPYQEIDVHAKVAGYVESIGVDIGDRVGAGQLLARLEVPELKDDLERAKAAVKHSEADLRHARAVYAEVHLQHGRLTKAAQSQPNLFAQQDLDAVEAHDLEAVAAVAAAEEQVQEETANVNKLQTMLDYSLITAPFAGVITKRYADAGALVQAGTSSQTQTLPLVRLSQNDRLRFDFPVSVSYVDRIREGDPVEIQAPAIHYTNTVRISRFTRKVDSDTRTMIVEVEVPNADLKIIPGIYGFALLKVDQRKNVLAIPLQAVSNEKAAPTVYVVGQDNQIEERTVRLGLETPALAEVLSGLQEHDRVMIGNRALVRPGQRVQPKPGDLGSPETHS